MKWHWWLLLFVLAALFATITIWMPVIRLMFRTFLFLFVFVVAVAVWVSLRFYLRRAKGRPGGE